MTRTVVSPPGTAGDLRDYAGPGHALSKAAFHPREEDDAFAAAEQEGADAAAVARAKALGPAGRKERAKARNARGGQVRGLLRPGCELPVLVEESCFPVCLVCHL